MCKMAESGEISMEKWLDVALNPIGSLALVERFDENTASLLRTFNILSPKIVDLTLSPYGFRIVESFLTIDEVYVRLAESLTEEWSGFEKVLKTEKGRYVCETLLKKKIKLFARKIITISPRDWWFKNVEALTILIKAITFSDIDIAKDFIFHEQMVVDLCDTPEGLYCVLKVISKLIDQPGWKNALADLIVFKSQSIAGCDAIAQAILYGDYLVNEVIEIIFCSRKPFDNSITVYHMIIRIIEQGSDSVKELIVNCLCQPNINPVISQIRNTVRFEDFKKACDSNFTPSQRKRLDNHMTSTRVRSVVDDCLTTNESDSMNTPDGGQNKKRKSGSRVTSKSSAKKPRAEVAKPQPSSSKATVPSLSHTVTVSTPTYRRIKVVSTPSTVTTLYSTLSPSAVLTPTVPTTTSFLRYTPSPHTVSTQPTVTSSATAVPIPSTTTPSVKPPPSTPTVKTRTVVSPTMPPHTSTTPAVDVSRLKKERINPEEDVISMAMSEKYSSLLSKLAKGTPKRRMTVFNCIRNALLLLMMDERGSEVVKWFILNGTPKQKEEIERKVEETMEDLVSNGGYGGAIAALVIDNCADSEKKKELSEKCAKAMNSTRDFPCSTLSNEDNDLEDAETECDEVEVVSQKINKQLVKKSTVAKVLGVKDMRPRYRVVRFREEDETCQMFIEIDHKMKQRTISGTDSKLFVENALRMAKDGVSQLFVDLVQERVDTWAMSDCGTRFLSGLIEEKLLRPHLVYAVASVLHLLRCVRGRSIVSAMLSELTCQAFAYYCISNNDDSPIVKLFRSEMTPDHCLIIGMEFVKICPTRMRELLTSPTGRMIAGYENGRRFIELLAKPHPEGYAWDDLLNLIPATPIDRSPNNDDLNEERWRHVLSEENGVVSIARGVSLSDEERDKIAEMFNLIEYVLEKRWPTPSEKKEFIASGKTKDGVSQLFIDKIRVLMESNPQWVHWMSVVAQDTELRPYLIAPMASVLHRMSWPSPLLDTMLLKGTQTAFFNACLEGQGNAPFVRLFNSDSQTIHYVEIGMQIAKAMPDRVHLSLAPPLGSLIAETAKGKQFFESLAKPLPEGCGWAHLLDITKLSVRID